MSSIKPTVLVIGGGIAGIKAAADLSAANVSVKLLEASSRLGGRLFTDRESSSKSHFELGGSWFHDTLRNPLFELAMNNGYKVYYDDSGPGVFNRDGALDPMDKIGGVVGDLQQYISYSFQGNEEKILREGDKSYREVIVDYFKDRNYNGTQFTANQIKWAPQIARAGVEFGGGANWNQLSGKWTGAGGMLGRDAYALEGYDKVIDIVKKPISKNDIIFNSIVKEINTTDGKIIVLTDNDKKYEADFVIVTVPLGVLQSNNINFIPSLPKTLKDSIFSQHIGGLGKVILEFEKEFWPKIDKWICLGESESDLKINNLTDEDINIKDYEWSQPILFVNNSLSLGVPILTCLVSEPLMPIFEKKPLKSFEYLKPMLQIASGLKDIPKPIKITTSKWKSNPFSLGSFGTAKVGDDRDKTISGLSNGYGKVRFAGEHTIEAGNACAHGAFMSGKREADFILGNLTKL